MMGRRAPMRKAEEVDTVCARHRYCYLQRPGVVRFWKRYMRRKERHAPIDRGEGR